MCNFFSFVSDGKGNFYYFNAKDRQELLENNPESYNPESYNFDSHSSIVHKYINEDPRQDDEVNKYEFDGCEFKIDQINVTDDSKEAEVWIRKFSKTEEFRKICELAVIQNIMTLTVTLR
jgi:hypothetical protein